MWRREIVIAGMNCQREDFLHLQSKLSEVRSSGDIDEKIEQFSNLINKVCDPLFAAKTIGNNNESKKNNEKQTSNQPWFDQDCIEHANFSILN